MIGKVTTSQIVWLQRPSGWRSLLILPCMVIFPSIIQSAVGNKDGLWTTVFAAAVFINEDNLSVESGKSQADAASGNEDANRDETSRPVPEAREPAPRQPEEPTKHHPAGSDEKAAHPAPAGQGHHLNATHDQQEVTKAVLRASQPRGEPSPRGKDAF